MKKRMRVARPLPPVSARITAFCGAEVAWKPGDPWVIPEKRPLPKWRPMTPQENQEHARRLRSSRDDW